MIYNNKIYLKYFTALTIACDIYRPIIKCNDKSISSVRSTDHAQPKHAITYYCTLQNLNVFKKLGNRNYLTPMQPSLYPSIRSPTGSAVYTHKN